MRKILNKLKNSNQKLLLGFSGGVDSRVLFELCLRAGVDFGVVHLDHGLRADSKLDAEFVERLCLENQIPCFMLSASVSDFARVWKTGLEDAGRRVRRTIFRQIAEREGYAWVLLAHQADDQIETILLNLKRGCGTHGLAGMREFFEIFWRPMLSITRTEILQFAHKNKLAWREDESNQSHEFLRNQIRHDLLPELAKADSHFRENLLKLARKSQKIAERQVQRARKFLAEKDFSRKKFLEFEMGERGEILREFWIKLHGQVEGFERVRALEIERLLERNIGRKKIKFGKFWLELQGGILRIHS